MPSDKIDLQFDQQHIWHPYTSLPASFAPYPVVSAQGVKIKLENGRELIDGMASWWCAIHGYNHPILNQAIKDQTDKMAHVMFGGLTHQPAVELAKKLIEITPEPLQNIFFSDSGSVAVEVAIKLALQYWQAKNQPDKNKLLSIKHGYHGDTFGAMAVCDPINGMHSLFKNTLAQHYFVDAPFCGDEYHEQDILELEQRLKQQHKNIAALILEPLVQGAGGMRIYNAEYLTQAQKLCEQYNVLLIADEIATGFGRTGTLFACEQANISPDIMCVGKALTGGTLSLAATLMTTEISQTISKGEPGIFMHGPTFMANPLACAVANASIELLLKSNWQENVLRIEGLLRRELTDCAELNQVKDVRVKGAVGVIEMNHPVDQAWMTQEFVKHGVWVRPFSNLVYIMPAYVIDDNDLIKVTTAMKEIVARS
ncbi:Adenosylmethionine-8-amino-7-oxononanoate aminotransferase [hydrothermal vent metagenome]|uniref:Adenosylmethionine-8-amino-7-oxononanoate aminotransferase n=1 Tax=hydrothermal vent metagenome TaxID=652676 RepID=A0A3B1A9F7_9ZZZZ